MQTFTTALANLDKFAYIGGFSGSSGVPAGRATWILRRQRRVYAEPAAFNKKVKCCSRIGSVEGPGTKTFSDALTKIGINNVYFESPEPPRVLTGAGA